MQPQNETIIFLTWVYSNEAKSDARTLIDSIRSFGGAMRGCPIWLFEIEPLKAPCRDLADDGVQVIPLKLPETVTPYAYMRKVYACLQAEEMAKPQVHSLVCLDPGCLIVKPPLLFDLGQSYDAAVRPVHIRNVGSLAAEPLDGFWSKVYATQGLRDVQINVESFVDRQRVRAYFNSAAFAVKPSTGLFHRWFDNFELLVNDREFQQAFCQDDWHQIFLHQAVLSTLIATDLDFERVRILPPDYGYPYNLHSDVPADRQALALNDLTCVIYEERSINPRQVDDIEIREPLKSWLAEHANPKGTR